ncbi:hypothetical protein BDK51DRAFT_34488 [Blyttiomyces helicus]|uniref:Cyclin-D1-binding protein 1-like N-terminal domain-containing protein n=1 Tax=Blyttiomyces helicus TaxID=388810 RepID=A0A4P9WIY3_9FUNG|nr:hypothetical protein BDK51DRAFT_34488 [Blyttiomyces helicus]|eukprot:RKO91100.1 hypothetical protein BDK51DRAFT_34488 [Blyttiomyces helicus]
MSTPLDIDSLIASLDALSIQSNNHITDLANDRNLAVAAAAFNEAQCHKDLENGSKVLSHNVAKLAVAANNRSREAPAALTEVSRSLLHIVTAVESIPTTLGATLRDDLRTTVSTLLQDVSALAKTLHAGCVSTNAAHGSMSAAGTAGIVIRGCEILQGFAVSNQVAVCKRVAASLGLVEDAIEEVEEMMSGEGGEDFGGGEAVEFTAVERELVKDGFVIVKATRLLLKKAGKILGAPESAAVGLAGPDRIQALDELAQLAQECSHCVDDLAHCVDAPIRLLDFSAAASAVVAKSQAFLAVANSIADTASGAWFDKIGENLGITLQKILARNTVR